MDCDEDAISQRQSAVMRLLATDPTAAAMEGFHLALQYRETGRVHNALPLFRTAIQALKDFPEERWMLCDAYNLYIASLLETNDAARARPAILEALSLARDAELVAWEVTFLNLAGRLEMNTGFDLVGARKMLERALHLKEEKLRMKSDECADLQQALVELDALVKARKAAGAATQS